jgi:hypothetical protein
MGKCDAKLARASSILRRFEASTNAPYSILFVARFSGRHQQVSDATLWLRAVISCNPETQMASQAVGAEWK